MKNVIGILYNTEFKESSFEQGCGGSETWVIQIAKEFVRHNYHVIVFCNCGEWYFYNSGVEYVDISYFESRIEYQHFNQFIFVRSLDIFYDIFVSHNDCKNIYLQSHDQFIWKDGIYNERFDYNDIETRQRFNKIKMFIALTDFHKEELMHYNNIPEDKIEIIGNGLDSEIFNNIDKIDIEKDNEILWTSAFGRGGDILVNHILPLVKREIIDFKVNICGYGDGVPEDIKNNPNVKFLGTLSKEDYYKEFKKHKVWFLPCVVPEDFGICAPEAVMCGAVIVSPYLHGMKDVLKPFTPLAMTNSYNIINTNNYHYGHYELAMNDHDFNNVNNEAAYYIINAIKNYNNPMIQKIIKCQKKYVIEKYTWLNIVNKWEKLFI